MNWDDHARSATNDSVRRRELARAALRLRTSLMDGLREQITVKSTRCPNCGQGLRKRVVEHPGRQMGMDGQTCVFCVHCGLTRVFDRTLDEAREFGTEHIAGVTGMPKGTTVMSMRGGKLEWVKTI